MNVPESRVYSSKNDLDSMLELLLSVRSPDRLADFPGPVDLHELLAIAAVQANTRLWFDTTGGLAAFALVDAYNNLHFEQRPESVSLEMES